MSRPFRFGIQISGLPIEGWQSVLQNFEALGYSTVFWPDHFGHQWDPLAALAGAAAVTERLCVGTLVCDVDFRHPVVLAKSAATIHLISGGRLELGLGAGWMQSDYDESGIPFDPIGVRLERLEEALEICRAMWTQEKTTYQGRHYQLNEISRAALLPEGERPRILVGGGGRRVLGIAGRHADIIGINPSMREGRITGDTARDLTADKLRQKIEWVRAGVESSGRSLHDVELNSLVFVVGISDDPKPMREGLARTLNLSVDEVADTPLALTGSPAEIRDRLEGRREQTGISYIVIQGGDAAMVEQFAEQIVAPLAGT
ncbi:MAG: TIGR03621 family F420-dependent LLM class oxidoreductase [Deltaproteobacteria bacterium]|jgi:probable F420-dependent oxidoreductase|nr:TIGR03621 family F420-dependent LLM class oxidoreductase [Deltaproteobacteria bacterium]MBW2384389.1 TIGR03621 family F420-dependent LLM class oxidoreductase [Deltaproteobacteria bacterium]MBW2696810.1 TIGR03621 family F420-dependent LLM class oxidoreductase [Deltaproteobacteria bacterium]